MKNIYILIILIFITHNGISQKIVWEQFYDSIPPIKDILIKENGNHLILCSNYVYVEKSESTIETKNKTQHTEKSIHTILTLNSNNEIAWNLSSQLEDNEQGNMLINSTNDDFILIKSKRETIEDKYVKKYYAQKFNNVFEEKWVKEIQTPYIYSELKGGINHTNSDYTLLFDGGHRELSEIIHFDANGNKLWSKEIKNSSLSSSLRLSSIFLTSKNEFILVGAKNKRIGRNTYGRDYAVLKLDSSGNTIWVKTYKDPNRHPVYKGSTAYKVVETQNGDFIIGGKTLSTEGKRKHIKAHIGKGSDEIGIFKIDKNGNLIWNKSYGGFEEENIKSLLLTDDERIMILASTRSRDGDVYKNYGGSDIWVVQLNADGNLIWEETYGGEYNDWGYDIYSDKKNSYTILGSRRITKKEQTSWIFKIEDHFDVSKPETHPIERKNKKKIMDVESINSEEDIDEFLSNQISRPYKAFNGKGLSLQVGDYLRNLESSKWLTEDFNQDGKLDLLIYGIDFQKFHQLFLVESRTNDTYKGVTIKSSYKKKFISRVSTINGKPAIIIGHSNKEKYYSYTYPSVNDTLVYKHDSLINYNKNHLDIKPIKYIEPIYNAYDTLVYKYNSLINYNKNPLDIKQIKSIEIELDFAANLPVILKLQQNKLEACKMNYERKITSTRKWKLPKKEYETICKAVAELNFSERNKPIMYLPSSFIELKLELMTGEEFIFNDNTTFDLTTLSILKLFKKYYSKIN